MRRGAFFAAALALALLGRAASAAPPTEIAERAASAADAAFAEGRHLLLEGDLEHACEKLAESDRLVPSGRAVINLADCQERRGQLASAHASFLEAARRAVNANLADVARHARDRAERLEPRLARVRLVVRPSSVLAGMTIERDGAALAPSDYNRADAFDADTVHTFVATAPGRPAVSLRAVAREGTTTDVELAWPEPPLAPARDVVVSPAPTSRALGWGLVGGGGASLALGLVAGAIVLDARSTVQSHCDASSRTCDDAGLSAASRGATAEIVAPIAMTVGVLAIGAGAYLLLAKNDRSKAATR